MGIVREAIFNILTSRDLINDVNVLDLFCGSGSLGFEAISRGAKHIFMVDSDYYNLQLVKKTAETLNVSSNVTLICASADKLPQSIAKCDLIFIDPPYYSNLVEGVLEGLSNSEWLWENTTIVLEIRKNESFTCSKNYHIIMERAYGITKIIFLQIKNTF